MAHINFECKAKVDNYQQAENILLQHNPLFIGTDHQIDTYFNVPTGRLKLRQGKIENSLIYYQRQNTASGKQSDVTLYNHAPDAALKVILTLTNGVKVVVDKKRKIYFIENVKFHFDTVEGLGQFIEIEAIDKDGTLGLEKLQQQFNHYVQLLQIQPQQMVAHSYSDLILEQQ
jgi:adenylate cyclase, class 2